jgi:hypothetical protein
MRVPIAKISFELDRTKSEGSQTLGFRTTTPTSGMALKPGFASAPNCRTAKWIRSTSLTSIKIRSSAGSDPEVALMNWQKAWF